MSTAEGPLRAALLAADASDVLVFTAYLTLPHTINLDNVTVPLATDAQPPWEGWTQAAAADLLGYELLAPIRPLARLTFRHAVGGGGSTDEMVDRRFPDIVDRYLSRRSQWERHLKRPLARLRWQRKLTTAAAVALLRPVTDLDSRSVDENQLIDDACRTLSDYCTALGAVSNDPLLGDLALADVQTPVPVTWYVATAGGGVRSGGRTHVSIHAWDAGIFAQSLTPNVLQETGRLFRRGREDADPTYPVRELRHEAQREALRGRRDSALILYTSSVEVLVDTCLQRTWGALGQPAVDLQPLLDEQNLPQRLDVLVGRLLTWQQSLPGARDDWIAACYRLRNRVIHEGYLPDSAEETAAMDATYALTGAIGAAIGADAHARGIVGEISSASG